MIFKIGRVFFCFTGCLALLAGILKAFEAGPIDQKLSSVCSCLAIAGLFVSMALPLKPSSLQRSMAGLAAAIEITDEE